MGELSTAPERSTWKGLSLPARAYILLVGALGLAAFVAAGIRWTGDDGLRFVLYAIVTSVGSGWKVRFPGFEATLSVNFFFSLLVAVELGFSEAVAIAGISGVIQSCWRPDHRPQPIQIPFNISVLSLSCAAAALAFDSAIARESGLDLLPRIGLAAAVQFAANSVLVTIIIVLTQKSNFLATLRGMFWSFSYYFAGALGVGLFHILSSHAGWQSALLSIPAAYLAYRSFQFYLDRLEAQRRHAQQMSDLQMRTIEALALAIECKDETTHDHLGRVQVYALEVGRELGLDRDQMEALRAASLLHDIGKLAVPESIINKPGRLTPDEFNKMKIHPGVGGEILSSVQFPYPVVPYVRSHHEKWDGSGYPDGLKGEEIPIGARIIAAVDCLDALASDRQYRKAMPLDSAIEIVRKESGKAFDPRIVDVLSRKYKEFEAKARRQSAALPKLSLNVDVVRGGAPATGFEQPRIDSLAALASAVGGRDQELRDALEVITEFGPRFSLEELAALLAVRLRRIIPYEGLAMFRVTNHRLEPVYATGEHAARLPGSGISFGQGLSGWVAENRKLIVNGNPSVEPGGWGSTAPSVAFLSSLSAPIVASGEVVGVLTLHAQPRDAFSVDDSRVIETICARLGQALERHQGFEARQNVPV